MSDKSKLFIGAAIAGVALATSYFLYTRSTPRSGESKEEQIESEVKPVSNQKIKLYVHSKT